ncbi:hypothetical protein ACFY5D_18070 [Paeniglutamicibacter sp. NPDC012692]|uniref:hypothetical protein n=1 Tax=Paeniglutamicibacter sp. NPDC012692 TaxID=3364388 RepID=UPI0036BCC52B
MSPFIIPALLLVALLAGSIGWLAGREVQKLKQGITAPENLIHADCVECDFESHPGTFSQAQAVARNHSKNTGHAAVMLVGPNG